MPGVRFRLSGIKTLITALALTITAGNALALNVGGNLTAEIPAPVPAASSETRADKGLQGALPADTRFLAEKPLFKRRAARRR